MAGVINFFRTSEWKEMAGRVRKTIEGLSSQGSYLQNYLMRGAREGKSGSELLSELRNAGYGYRRETFYHDYAIVQSSMGKWKGMKWTPHNRVIREEWYKTTKAPLPTNYQTTFKIRAIDKSTGEVKDRFVTISHDWLKTREDLEAEAVELMQSESEELEAIEVMPVKALKSSVEWVV